MTVALGVKAWEKNEALVSIFLGVHGLLVLLYLTGEGWQWLLVSAILFIGLRAQYAAKRTANSIELRAVAILVTAISLMLSTGGTASFFTIWLLALVGVYSLVMRPPFRQAFPYVISLAYFSLIPFSENAVSVLEVGFRALSFFILGSYINKLSSLVQQGGEAKSKAEESIRHAKALGEKSPQGAAIYQLGPDKRLVFLWANQAFDRIQKINSLQLVGKTLEEIFPNLAESEVLADYKRVAAGGKSTENELVIYDEEGKRREIKRALHFYGINIGEDRIAVFVRDITKTEEAEQALRQSEAKHRNILDIASEAIISVDEDQKIVLFNHGAEKIFGFRALEVLGRPLDMLLPELLTEKHRMQLSSFADSADSARAMGERSEVSGKRKDGSVFPAEASISKINLDGRPLLTAFLRDVSERKSREAQLQSQLDKLAAQQEIERAMMGTVDLRITLNIILDQVLAKLGVVAASVFLLDADTHILEFAAGHGVDANQFENLGLHLGEGYSGKAALERKSIFVADLDDPENEIACPTPLKGFRTLYSEPLMVRSRTLGVLELLQRTAFQPDDDWKNFAEALARQTAIAIDNALLFETMQRSNDELNMAYRSTLLGWSKALELRDDETEGHTKRVKDMTLRLAKTFGIRGEELMHIRHGALLHDVGKIAIPDHILLKPGPLDDEERELMKSHPQHAKDMITPIDYLRAAMGIPYSHHEKWDGSGYPEGLKGRADSAGGAPLRGGGCVGRAAL